MAPRLAFSVLEAARAAAVGRSTVYEAIRNHELIARKAGRRTVILAADLTAWLQALPSIKPSAPDGHS